MSEQDKKGDGDAPLPKLSQEMVEKSLSINPQLKRGRKTEDFIDGFKELAEEKKAQRSLSDMIEERSQEVEELEAESSVANRWLDALYESKTIEDDVADHAVKQFKAGPTSEKEYRKALIRFLNECAAELAEEKELLAQTEVEINEELAEVLVGFRRQIADFLVAAQPGPLSDLSRLVLREKEALMDKLAWKVTELNSSLLAVFGKKS